MDLVFETEVPAPRDAVFSFHAAPANLEVLMRGWPGFRILRHDGSVRPGSRTWIVQTVAGCVPLAMGFLHGEWDPPSRFEEEMVHGPFARFHHLHEFEERPGATLVRDRIGLRLRPEWGGEVATGLVVGPALRRFFAHRHEVLRRLAADGALDLLPPRRA